MITLNDVTFTYEDQEQPTLKQVSFHVKRGEWLAIVGHNGSGKSTTVRLIDGLLEVTSGEILIGGERLTAENVWKMRQKIGMVFQNPDNQFVGATVEDDVAFALESKGVPRDEMLKRVDEALSLVGMSEFKTKEPARLSGGQKQRVAIAGALAMRPDILILDEATSMLDPKGRLELIQVIQDIRDQFDMTIISITHDLDEIALSDRVLVMKKGQVALDTTPRQLFEKGDELLPLGLDRPFTSTLIDHLSDVGIKLSSDYLTEKELEDELWELLSKT